MFVLAYYEPLQYGTRTLLLHRIGAWLRFNTQLGERILISEFETDSAETDSANDCVV